MAKNILSLTALLALFGAFAWLATRTQPVSMDLKAPKAAKKPHTHEKFGDIRPDEYYWLRERENPEVIAYLTAENAWTQASMAHTESLQKTLFKEMKGRIKEDDNTVPALDNGYFYYVRTVEGGEYGIHCRKQTLAGQEVIILDENERAKGHDFYSLSTLEVSDDNRILAFGEDKVGRRFYDLSFKDLTTGQLLPDFIPATSGDCVFAADNKTVFYSRQDAETLRSHQVWRHTLGTDPKQDVLVFEEKDETFSVGVGRTKSKEYLIIGSQSTLTTEAQFLDAKQPNGTFKPFLSRERGHEYHVDHANGHWYIVTNWNARNFRVMQTETAGVAKTAWTEVIPHRDDVLVEEIELFKDYLVVGERKAGLVQLRVRSWDGKRDVYVPFNDPAYIAYTDANAELNAQTLRYGYQSMTTPNSILEFSMATGETKVLKQQEVLGGFNAANYKSERIWATAKDGTKVPVSLVYHKDTKRDGTAPLLLYAYGSYGISMDAGFRSTRLSLLDRGFVYAIAHIRGGQEMGRVWYEDGKLMKKMNTFTDFIACGEFLINEKYAAANKLFAMGGSAGGLLMGAVVNLRPDLWRGVVAAVPFVDVMTTMLDETIPLTTGEYDEWGNPNEEAAYRYMRTYSPYDNVEAKAYPNMLVTTGLHDSQVQYWEPAKWVARLRDVKTDNNRLLLHTNMDAGHGGKSGRFSALHEVALEWAFMLDLAM